MKEYNECHRCLERIKPNNACRGYCKNYIDKQKLKSKEGK